MSLNATRFARPVWSASYTRDIPPSPNKRPIWNFATDAPTQGSSPATSAPHVAQRAPSLLVGCAHTGQDRSKWEESTRPLAANGLPSALTPADVGTNTSNRHGRSHHDGARLEGA